MNIFKLVLMACTLAGSLLAQTAAEAAAPLKRSVENFELGMSADKAMELMTQTYPGCAIKRGNHKEDSGEMTDILTEYTVDAGELDKVTRQLVCNDSERIADRVTLKFVNPDSNPSQPVYEIALRRSYGDPEKFAEQADYTLDEISKQLFAKYGKPSAQMRARTTSVNDPSPPPASKGKSKKNKAAPVPASPDAVESYNVVYVWGGPGLKPQLFSFCMEKCGNYYMTADLVIFKKGKQLPKNTFYVKSLAIRMIDTQLDAKQYDWVYERIKRIRSRGKVF